MANLKIKNHFIHIIIAKFVSKVNEIQGIVKKSPDNFEKQKLKTAKNDQCHKKNRNWSVALSILKNRT